MNATVVGTFHSGFRITDETTGYVLLKTAQILERQTGIVNEIRVRTRDPMAARLIASASVNRPAINRFPGRRRRKTCSPRSRCATC